MVRDSNREPGAATVTDVALAEGCVCCGPGRPFIEHQLEITPDSLHGFAEKFAAEHKLDLPFVVDPAGKLAALVIADRELGKSINLQHTPTIFVVSNKRAGKPFVEVVDRTQLYALIDSMKRE